MPGPRYPSSFISGVAPGTRTTDNVASGRELKYLTQSVVAKGQYPSDQQLGSGILTNQTQTVQDLDTIIAAVATAITAFQAAKSALTTNEIVYAANLHGLPIHTLTRRLEEDLREIYGLTTDYTKVHGNVPADQAHPMPSDLNRGWTGLASSNQDY